MGWLGKLLSGGAIKSIENIATEWIQTDRETAEAKAIMVKTIDPNGKMRRDLSQFASIAYGFYLIATTVLIFMSVWGVGGDLCAVVEEVQQCVPRADAASERMTGLFVPITASWSAIVGASFGVNGVNSFKGRP